MKKRKRLPQRRYRRMLAKPLAKLLLSGFVKQRVYGLDNFPSKGPYIVAGNHRGIMEVFLMVAVCPRPMEVLGAGDIPLDPSYRYLADFYGYIPYKRGQMDRRALMAAEGALKEGRIVGIFPEGGIWKSGRKSAHRGVAWLSFVTGAPVVPVGFAGVYRAVARAIRLEKPYLETWVGKPLPVPERDRSKSRRDQITEHANHVLDIIETLVPQWDIDEHAAFEDEEYELQIWEGDHNWAGDVDEPELIAEFFHIPVLIDALYRNLNRKGLWALRRFGPALPSSDIAHALNVIIGYASYTNPAFFPYRLGDEKSERLLAGLKSFRDLCENLSRDGKGQETRLSIVPIHRYRVHGDPEIHVLREPPPIERF
ncbi:MAG: lysophospholipid acyltransferase family protein [Spirochaetales bacterium]